MVLALERYEACSGNRGSKLAALVERHAHIAAAMRNQSRDAKCRRQIKHIEPLHLPEQLRGNVGCCRHTLQIAPPAMLFGCPVRNEKVGKKPTERRIVAAPTDADEVDERLGLQALGLGLRACPRTLTIGIQEHQM